MAGGRPVWQFTGIGTPVGITPLLREHLQPALGVGGLSGGWLRDKLQAMTHISSVVPGRYWHRLDEARIQCDVCPRFCKLRDGQRGLCFVRAAEEGRMVLTTYGRSSGFCIDPVEKKPLNHFLPGTPVLSFGTAGCNLTCKFC